MVCKRYQSLKSESEVARSLLFALFHFWDDYQETKNPVENFWELWDPYEDSQYINRIIIKELTTVCKSTGLRLFLG